MKDLINGAIALVFAVIFIFGFVAMIIWGFNTARISIAEAKGKSILAEAEFSRQVQLEEAKANLESQKLNAQSEVERAKGASKAIEIENGKLTEQYIRYLYVQNLEKLDTELIYVPTEGGLPLLEAGRLNK